LTIAVISTGTSAAQLDKPSILGDPRLILQDAQHPIFAPPGGGTTVTTPQPSLKVTSSQIGLQNPTPSSVAAVIEMGGGKSNVVLLRGHESQTIDCSGCPATVRAIVPRGSAPEPTDFSINLRPGSVYKFRYDDNSKRWILTP
jgi:hypothetical protein